MSRACTCASAPQVLEGLLAATCTARLSSPVQNTVQSLGSGIIYGPWHYGMGYMAVFMLQNMPQEKKWEHRLKGCLLAAFYTMLLCSVISLCDHEGKQKENSYQNPNLP